MFVFKILHVPAEDGVWKTLETTITSCSENYIEYSYHLNPPATLVTVLLPQQGVQFCFLFMLKVVSAECVEGTAVMSVCQHPVWRNSLMLLKLTKIGGRMLVFCKNSSITNNTNTANSLVVGSWNNNNISPGTWK